MDKVKPMKINLFGKKSTAPHSTLDHMVQGIESQLQTQGSIVSKDLVRSALSMESLDTVQQTELSGSVQQLSAALETIVGNFADAGQKFTDGQMGAGVAAGILAGNVTATLAKRDAAALESFIPGATVIATPFGAGNDNVDRIRPALEAYNEAENRNVAAYSIAYNMQAARQDEFGEAFFPTIVVSPDQAGFAVSIRIVNVYNEVRRSISGELNDFGFKNIIQAVIDPDILRNDQTKIVPVYRDESKQYFVDPNLVAPYEVLLDGESVTTAPLAMGKKFSLLGISQTEHLLETGILDSTDDIDQAITLQAAYLRLKGAAADGSEDEVVQFNVGRLPYSNFTYSVQGNYRLANLAFSTESLKIDKNTKLADSSASTLLAAIASGELTVRLGTNISGTVNLQTAAADIFSSDVHVVSVTTDDGTKLAPTDSTYLAVAAIFEGASMIGYDLDARRSNMNRRQRGQLLDTTVNHQVYQVPLRAPISIPRPLTNGDQTDSSDLAGLITATRIRASNAAVDEVLRVADMLKEYVNNNDAVGDVPAILGTGRYLLKPFYHEAIIDVEKDIDSLNSQDRPADISALLVNKLRDVVYRMYRDSGYKAAADALAGGESELPMALIGTDPIISRYINVSGDLRTLGGNFQHRLVTTLNKRMSGKIVVTLGNFSGGEGVPNPLHFGNMAWKPELTLVLPLHRNGQTSKELTVQPSFLHVTHSPLLAVIEVKNIEKVVANKVAIQTKQL